MPWYSPIPMVYFLGVRAVGASRHAAFQEYTYEDIGDELWG